MDVSSDVVVQVRLDVEGLVAILNLLDPNVQLVHPLLHQVFKTVLLVED